MPDLERNGHSADRPRSLGSFADRELLGLGDPEPFSRGRLTAAFPKVVHWIADPSRTREELSSYVAKLGGNVERILAPYYAKQAMLGTVGTSRAGTIHPKTELSLLRLLALHFAGIRQGMDTTMLAAGNLKSSTYREHVDHELLKEQVGPVDEIRDQFYIRNRTEFSTLNELFGKIQELSSGALTPESIFRVGHVPQYLERVGLKHGRHLSLEQMLLVVLVIVTPPYPNTVAAIQNRIDQRHEIRGYDVKRSLDRVKALSQHTLQLFNDRYIVGSRWFERRKKNFGDDW